MRQQSRLVGAAGKAARARRPARHRISSDLYQREADRILASCWQHEDRGLGSFTSAANIGHGRRSAAMDSRRQAAPFRISVSTLAARQSLAGRPLDSGARRSLSKLSHQRRRTPYDRVAATSRATDRPLSQAPPASWYQGAAVASPAKKILSATGRASSARAPWWPGSAAA